MDDGVADVDVLKNADDLSLPERMMRVQGRSDEVKKILAEVHYCWPQTELVK
jgi:hypothetical protein